MLPKITIYILFVFDHTMSILVLLESGLHCMISGMLDMDQRSVLMHLLQLIEDIWTNFGICYLLGTKRQQCKSLLFFIYYLFCVICDKITLAVSRHCNKAARVTRGLELGNQNYVFHFRVVITVITVVDEGKRLGDGSAKLIPKAFIEFSLNIDIAWQVRVVVGK
jgi:hypothetical protein